MKLSVSLCLIFYNCILLVQVKSFPINGPIVPDPGLPIQLQEQMEILREMQPAFTPYQMNPVLQPVPLMFLVPNAREPANEELKDPMFTRQSEASPFQKDAQKATDDIDSNDQDSVVIDSENVTNDIPPKTLVLFRSGNRFFIGQIISAIPFLPFEVNVPDTVSWAWNGISSIISGIGQRFRPKPQQEMQQEAVMKFWRNQFNPNRNLVKVMPSSLYVMPMMV